MTAGGDDAEPVEARWLRWARGVVLADGHTEECVSDGGGTLEPDGEPGLRWPGYLGSAYRPGGLLLVANVHQRFSSANVPPSVGAALVSATKALRADPDRAQDDYLRTTQAAYRQALGGRPRWKVAVPFQWLLDDLGLGWDDVAYTNAGKTQVGLGDRIDDVVAGCLQAFPLSRLVAAIEPAAVVTCAARARDALAGGAAPSFYFRQSYPKKALVAEVAEQVGPLLRVSRSADQT